MVERWAQHKNESGRPYYHEAVAGTTVWRKPDALLTPTQVSIPKKVLVKPLTDPTARYRMVRDESHR